MNRTALYSVMLMLLTVSSKTYSQESYSKNHCTSPGKKPAAKTTVASPDEDKYDVKYVKLDVSMTNATTTIGGNVITKAVSVVASLPSYVFEIKAPLTVDSVFIDGVRDTFTIAGDVCTVPFTTPRSMGTLFTAQVFYHGTPIPGAGFNVGITSANSPSWGTRATFTLSESYHAKDWWPCKQSLMDKIDSCDVWITVPDSLKAGSNGMLTNITPVDATHDRYEWKERYPIDYYLISAAVAPYVEYSYYMHFSGSSDSMLVQNYVYSNPATLPYFKSVIDSTGMMIDYFSKVYGRYPFWKEKYGHCMAKLSGGMEHQTMTTLGFFEGTLVAHELGHQWFGDNVTCATWADIFVNESFAAYSEYLFIDHFRNHAKATTDIRDRQDNVKSAAGGTVYVDDTTNENRIFDSRLSYDKGACALHMLRSIVNDDSLYFSVYRNYQQQMRDSTATAADFATVAKNIAGTVVNGINLDTFFNQWMYKEGFPTYTITWNQADTNVFIKISQNTSVPSSVSYFSLPVEMKLTSATGSTVVRLNNDQQDQVFTLSWNQPITSLVVDPKYWLVYDLNSITKDVSLGTVGTGQLSMSQLQVAPNPATTGWQVQNIPVNSTLSLTDVNGRLLWSTDNNASTTVSIPAQALSTGMYMLRITGNGSTTTTKLIKQ
jgi:aminopeptidase N